MRDSELVTELARSLSARCMLHLAAHAPPLLLSASSDTLGTNLNRVYGAPSPTEHPTVFALCALVRQLHESGRLMFYIDCHAHSNKRGWARPRSEPSET